MSRRDLLRDLFGRPKFRSRREKAGHYIYNVGIGLPVVVPVAFYPWFVEWIDSVLLGALLVFLAVIGLRSAGWLVWEFWGRKRFPLPAPDESKSTA